MEDRNRRPVLAPVNRRGRVLVAALLWTLVGSTLAAMGLVWTLLGVSSFSLAAACLVAAGGVGVAKGRWILAPRARANVARITATGDRETLFNVLSATGWSLVGGMMILGWVLRHSGIPRATLGPIYAAVGIALLVGAIPSWGAWRRMDSPVEGGGGTG